MSYQFWLYIYISKVKLATIVKGDQKAPFSIATTLRCRGGRYSFPLIAPLYLRYVPNIAQCSTRKYQVPFLKSLVWHNLGLNPVLLDHWRTLYTHIYLHILYICKNNNKNHLQILETITIKNNKPTINKIVFTTSINIFNVFNN